MLSPLSRLLHSETAFEDRFACPGCSRCGTRSGRWPRRYHNIEMPPEKPERTINAEVLSPYLSWRSAMSKFGIIGATALSLTLAVAGPALAAGRGGGSAHFGGGGGAHFAGGGGMRGGGAMNMGGGGAFRGAQASTAFRGAQASTAFRGAQASMGPSPV